MLSFSDRMKKKCIVNFLCLNDTEDINNIIIRVALTLREFWIF